VPGVSPAAMQMGKQTARNILGDLKDRPRKNFVYTDKGSMATIGKSKAIADIRGWRFRGVIAWMFWLVVHIMFLIGFRNRISVLGSWLWAYLTRGRSALLITGDAEDLINAITFMEGDESARVLEKISGQKPDASRHA